MAVIAPYRVKGTKNTFFYHQYNLPSLKKQTGGQGEF